MKGLGVFIVLILIVAGLLLLRKPSEAPVIQDENSSEEQMETGENMTANVSGSFSFDTSASSANWTGSKKIIKEWIDKGTIDVKSGNVVMENGNITGGEVVFDMTSITAVSTGMGDGQDRLSTHLKSDDFFAVETNPEAKFMVKSAEKTGDNTFNLTGDLTIKGITNETVIPVVVSESDEGVQISGSATIDRSAYEVKFGSDKFFENLGDNVINDEFMLDFVVLAK